MFLRATTRKKDGKEHRYFSIVENKRVRGGRVLQRHVLYLGEINSSQEFAWRKSIEVLEEGIAKPRTLSLFPEDRCEGLVDGSIVRLKLSQLRLERPRQWGGCWLALTLWRELQLEAFWAERLPPSRKGTRWDEVLAVLVVYRLLSPGSEWRLLRQWYQAARCRICWAATAPSTFIRFTRVMIASSSTRRHCSIIWYDAGGIYSTSASTYCCTTSPARTLSSLRRWRMRTSVASATRAIIDPIVCRW
jgi:hypothetical protein